MIEAVFVLLVLGSFATILFILAGFVFLRVSIFGLVRLGIFDHCVHELSHVLDSSLELAKFVHRGLELAVPFQDNHCSLGCNSVSGVDYI